MNGTHILWENMSETDAVRAALRSPGGPAGTRGRDSNANVISPAPGGTAADVSDQERLAQDLALFLSNPTLRSALADGSLDLASYSSTVEAELATLESECIGIYRANAGNLSHLRTEMDECDAVLASLQELLLGFQADLAGGDFAQGGHAGLVARFDLGRVALAQHAGAVGRSQHQLEAVGDLLQAVFDGDAGHVFLRNKPGQTRWSARNTADLFRR